jgi:hypothetical protein
MKIYPLSDQNVGTRTLKKRPKMVLGLHISKNIFVLSNYRARRDQNWYLEFTLGLNAVFGDCWRKYEKLTELVEVLREKKNGR